METTRQDLEIMISRGELDIAISILKEATNGIEESLYIETLMQSSNLNRVKKEFGQGVVSEDNYNLRYSKILLSLLQIMERLPNDRLLFDTQEKIKIAKQKYDSGNIEEAKSILLKITQEKDSAVSNCYYLLGKCYFEEGEYDLALLNINKSIHINNTLPDYYWERAQIHIIESNFEDFVNDCKSAIILYSGIIQENPAHALALFGRGMIYMEIGQSIKGRDDLSIALKEFSELISQNAEDADLYLKRAECYDQLRIENIAVLDIKKYISLNPDSNRSKYLISKIYFRNGEFDKALKNINYIINIFPKNIFYLFERAKLHFEMSNHKLSISDLNEASSLVPGYIEIDFLKGKTNWQKNNDITVFEMKKVINKCNIILNIDKEFLIFINIKGIASYFCKHYEECIYYMNSMMIQGKPDPICFFYRGFSYLAINKYEESLADANSYLQLLPSNWQGYYIRGLSYNNLNEGGKAKSDADYIIELNPYTSEGYYLNSLINYNAENFHQALLSINIALEKDTISDYYLLKAKCLFGLKHYSQTEEVLNELLELDPNNAEAHSIRSYMQFELNNLDESWKSIEKASLLVPDEYDYVYFKARILTEKGQHSLAMSMYDQIPNDYRRKSAVLFEQGKIQRNIGDFEKSILLFKKAIGIEQNYSYYFELAQTYLLKEDKQKAIEICNKAIEINSKLPNIFCFRGEVYFDVGNYHNAFLDLDKAIELDPFNHHYYFTRGCFFLCQEKYSKSLNDLNKAVSLNINSGEYYYFIGRIYKIIGNKHLAKESFKKSMDLGYSEAANEYNNMNSFWGNLLG